MTTLAKVVTLLGVALVITFVALACVSGFESNWVGFSGSALGALLGIIVTGCGLVWLGIAYVIEEGD